MDITPLLLPELVMDLLSARDVLSNCMDLSGYRLGILDLCDRQKDYFLPVVMATQNPQALQTNIQKVFYYPGEKPVDYAQVERKPLPAFPYMHSSYLPFIFELTDEACDLCEAYFGYAYTGPIYTEVTQEDLLICPACLVSGRAAKKLHATFQAGIESPPKVSSRIKTDLYTRTPGFQSNQDIFWKVCCDKPCQYLGSTDVHLPNAQQLQLPAGNWHVFECMTCSAQQIVNDAD